MPLPRTQAFANALRPPAETWHAPPDPMVIGPDNWGPDARMHGPSVIPVTHELSKSFEIDGREVLLPSVLNGRQLSDEQIVQEYYSGNLKPIGAFDSPAEATAAAKARSERAGVAGPSLADMYAKALGGDASMSPPPLPMPRLAGNVPQRHPRLSELEFFNQNPGTAGMATADQSVTLNPYSGLSPEQRHAVALNEAARVYMQREQMRPDYDLTPAQAQSFGSYGPMQAQRETIAGRLLSGDPSAGEPTPEQQAYVRALAGRMGVPARNY